MVKTSGSVYAPTLSSSKLVPRAGSGISMINSASRVSIRLGYGMVSLPWFGVENDLRTVGAEFNRARCSAADFREIDGGFPGVDQPAFAAGFGVDVDTLDLAGGHRGADEK